MRANHGRLFQINTSQGGVPKLARSAEQVGYLGLKTDRQGNPDIHGGKDAALCLYSLERIIALQEEDHPIFPGAIGENLTLIGLDWSAVFPGVQLCLGSEVLIEVTRYSSPCNSIAAAFKDRDYHRVSQKKYPGWSRVYGRVLQPGWLHPGDEVRIHQP